MKKIIAIAALVAATSASAGFFNNNNTTWNNGYQEDNGIFSFNPYSFWEPRWYIQEANNFMNEVDDSGDYNLQSGHSFPVASRGLYSNN
jgi:hypothetical protein